LVLPASGDTLATSRSTVAALRAPMPVSMTSTAFLPTTMPTLGTSEAEPSGMAQTCGVRFSVTPSRTSDGGAAAGGAAGAWAGTCACAVNASRAAANNVFASRMFIPWVRG
jgi:hypothetical protein